MKLGLMQPYFFPYVGYFTLVASVDVFVFYDDAAFSKNSWYNRNRILSPNKPWEYIRISVRHTPLGTPCNAVPLFDKEADLNRIRELLKVYRKAPFFDAVANLVNGVFANSGDTLAAVASQSIIETCRYLHLPIHPIWSSDLAYDRYAPASAKVKQICALFQASEYINVSGGQSLYEPADFAAAGMKLRFTPPAHLAYDVDGLDFVPNLSILDVLMWLPPERVVDYLNSVKVD